MITLAVRSYALRRARIAYCDRDTFAFRRPVNGNTPPLRQSLDAVIHRIFQQRLKNQRWHQPLAWQALDVPLHPQALAKAQAFHSQIAFGDVDFFIQRDAFRSIAQGDTEQV